MANVYKGCFIVPRVAKSASHEKYTETYLSSPKAGGAFRLSVSPAHSTSGPVSIVGTVSPNPSGPLA